MHLLILGGTSFLGRALVEQARNRNHTITVLNRGTKPAPDGATSLVGDRLTPNGLDALDGLTFDAVIDTWAAEPPAAIEAMQKLQGRVGHYTIMSTVSVYDKTKLGDGDRLNDETTPVCEIVGPNATTSPTSLRRRGFEAAAEKILQGTPCLFARCGVMAGPYEASLIERSRLPWWLDRMRRGGRTLAPGPAHMPVQIIDVRDVAEFLVRAAERKLEGPYNLLSPPGSAALGQVLELCREITGNKAQLVWKTQEEIIEAGIKPFVELPLWLEHKTNDYATVYGWDTAKAKSAGLRCRPIEDTVMDTWAWMTGINGPKHAPEGVQLKLLGLSPEREALVLDN
ncbi:hypothetical protein VHEMI07743 [[Torrubiella] hemipterigena]|uniref:NAD-dependent epimerase/dehydratase domain-containing protein n=1 Tax=[Torrubiella] hemipterigena TaxID=1531966 RepID=A0A0A1TLX7_9HYPO|nr:hypothetical protein VHEMI07743 [[Torrubiella] hemipterigena]